MGISKVRVVALCRRVCAGGSGGLSMEGINRLNLEDDPDRISDVGLAALLGQILILDGCGDLEEKLTKDDQNAMIAFYEDLLTG